MERTRRLIALDPGLNRSGLAFFVEGELVFARTVQTPSRGTTSKTLEMSQRIEDAVQDDVKWTRIAELPKVYRGSPVDPEDLLLLAAVAGSFRPDVFLRPAEWKKQIPKTKKIENYLIKKRVELLLSDAETKRIDDWLYHDAWDAVGMGLVFLGRAGPGLVKP